MAIQTEDHECSRQKRVWQFILFDISIFCSCHRELVYQKVQKELLPYYRSLYLSKCVSDINKPTAVVFTV